MPLATHLLLKYSDVLADPVLGNGSRSPRNYFEQLLRCATETTVDIFATINNRFILDRLGPDDHKSLESQFISDSIASKVDRERHRRVGEPDSFVFTRVGSLLNLETLIGLGFTAESSLKTAIGACALHPNDYSESLDTSAVSSGPLSVVTEFAAVREHNTPKAASERAALTRPCATHHARQCVY